MTTPTTTYHCEHGVYCGEDNWDAECCMCSDNPCPKVTVSTATRHGQQLLRREQESYEAQIAYVLEHGKREEVPF
jgi:hypothetical protein